MNALYLTERELAEVNGGDGISWGAGFLTGVQALPTLGVLVTIAVSLASNYSAYQAGVNAGYNAAAAA